MRRALLLALVLGACFDAIQFPTGFEVIYPVPKDYLYWFGEVEQCSGIRGHFGTIEWYAVPAGIEGFETARGRADGEWIAPNRLFISTYRLDDEFTVKHEILHFLEQEPGHDQVAWTRCQLIRLSQPGPDPSP